VLNISENKLKVAWLADCIFGPKDFNKHQVQGGAEKTDELIINHGRSLGHQIDVVVPEGSAINPTAQPMKEPNEILKRADLVVISNAFYHHIELVNWVVENKKFVKYEHDATFCMYRNPNCQLNCLSKGMKLCNPPFYHKLFSKAALTIFLSPLQRGMHLNWFKKDIKGKHATIPAPLARGQFSPNPDPEKQKNGCYLYIGGIVPAKGIKQIVQDFQNHPEKVFFAGPVYQLEHLRLIKDNGFNYLGEVPYDEVPALMQQYEFNLQYQTAYIEMHGRTIIEAMASGCKIVAKDSSRIGALSWGLKAPELVEKCYEAPKLFWEEIFCMR